MAQLSRTSHRGPKGPISNACRAINSNPVHAARCHMLSVVQAATNSISKPSISQRSQFKEETVKHSVPAWDFNLKAHAAIILTQADWALNSGHVGQCCQVARTVTLALAPLGQAFQPPMLQHFFSKYHPKSRNTSKTARLCCWMSCNYKTENTKHFLISNTCI